MIISYLLPSCEDKERKQVLALAGKNNSRFWEHLSFQPTFSHTVSGAQVDHVLVIFYRPAHR